MPENNSIKDIFKAGYKNVGSEISITKGQSNISNQSKDTGKKPINPKKK